MMELEVSTVRRGHRLHSPLGEVRMMEHDGVGSQHGGVIEVELSRLDQKFEQVGSLLRGQVGQ